MERKLYRFERVGRRIVLQIFRARPEDAPCCIVWERVRAKDVPAITRELAARGIAEFSPR
jgi:hypothetical protein